MNSSVGAKLFHTIVIVGMSLSACSSDENPSPSGDSGTTAANDSGGGTDTSTSGGDSGGDSGIVPTTDAAGDSFAGWFCCA